MGALLGRNVFEEGSSDVRGEDEDEDDVADMVRCIALLYDWDGLNLLVGV